MYWELQVVTWDVKDWEGSSFLFKNSSNDKIEKLGVLREVSISLEWVKCFRIPNLYEGNTCRTQLSYSTVTCLLPSFRPGMVWCFCLSCKPLTHFPSKRIKRNVAEGRKKGGLKLPQRSYSNQIAKIKWHLLRQHRVNQLLVFSQVLGIFTILPIQN